VENYDEFISKTHEYSSEWCDLDVKYGGNAAVDCGKTAIDRRTQLVWLADEFAMGAERATDIREAPLLALPPRTQLRLERIGRGGKSLGIYPLY
jgi:hypothetical protein